jgi:hypothetical protein
MASVVFIMTCCDCCTPPSGHVLGPLEDKVVVESIVKS